MPGPAGPWVWCGVYGAARVLCAAWVNASQCRGSSGSGPCPPVPRTSTWEHALSYRGTGTESVVCESRNQEWVMDVRRGPELRTDRRTVQGEPGRRVRPRPGADSRRSGGCWSDTGPEPKTRWPGGGTLPSRRLEDSWAGPAAGPVSGTDGTEGRWPCGLLSSACGTAVASSPRTASPAWTLPGPGG